ncbi:MAG: N-acetylmuramoyl-L-alanine amidase [Bacillota bacterium]|nr:N-acetylmuramoyl-L-alanine amidase [Bacillota bacterium]
MNKNKGLAICILIVVLMLNACAKIDNDNNIDKSGIEKNAGGNFQNNTSNDKNGINKSSDSEKSNNATKQNADNTKSDNKAVLSGTDVANSKQSQATVSPTGKLSNSKKKKVLEGLIICIDPGHQQKENLKTEKIAPGSKESKEKNTSGTSGVYTKVPEYALNLDVSMILKDELEKEGAKVVMTRTTNNVDLSNIERAQMANSSKARLVIRIHADGSESKNVSGISVLIPGNKYIKDNTILTQSRKAGEAILNSLIKSTSAKSRGVIARNDLTGFNWSKVPVVLIEMGFMTNPYEDTELNTDKYRRKIVTGIIDGLKVYFNK